MKNSTRRKQQTKATAQKVSSPHTRSDSYDILTVNFLVTTFSALSVTGIFSMIIHFYVLRAFKQFIMESLLNHYTTSLLLNFLLCLFCAFAYQLHWRIGKLTGLCAAISSTLVSCAVFWYLHRDANLTAFLAVLNMLVGTIATAASVLALGGKL